MHTIGIIGGVGPSASAQFYLTLQQHANHLTHRPHILLDSLPIPFCLEENILTKGARLEPYKPLLIESAKKLAKGGADFITLPCNTLSCFISEIQSHVPVPVLNIIDLTVKSLAHNAVDKVGLLATSQTIQQSLYLNTLSEHDISLELPTSFEQKQIDQFILSQVSNAQALNSDYTPRTLLCIAKRMIESGAEQIILGCTDLPPLTNKPTVNPISLLAQESLRLISKPQKTALTS
ncbi:aspartate/glutamate racemase family protein [Pseudoalteromonas umbrosa]|uniref:aspartate/glutamate racemase family protein n=1 Tax=Pseudoalteromonas umbrosa TaxID=3048489 RepID=UPI0024C3D1EC|nr:amino acid racemase [Pseudoalteromonas sp. B95]MDK1289365.1 amino acid racemase [Pseudoalteromonas sp. B95]